MRVVSDSAVVSQIRELVMGFFQDEKKTKLWFETPNYHLGNIAPNVLISVGRERKLLAVVQTLTEENG